MCSFVCLHMEKEVIGTKCNIYRARQLKHTHAGSGTHTRPEPWGSTYICGFETSLSLDTGECARFAVCAESRTIGISVKWIFMEENKPITHTHSRMARSLTMCWMKSLIFVERTRVNSINWCGCCVQSSPPSLGPIGLRCSTQKNLSFALPHPLAHVLACFLDCTLQSKYFTRSLAVHKTLFANRLRNGRKKCDSNETVNGVWLAGSTSCGIACMQKTRLNGTVTSIRRGGARAHTFKHIFGIEYYVHFVAALLHLCVDGKCDAHATELRHCRP